MQNFKGLGLGTQTKTLPLGGIFNFLNNGFLAMNLIVKVYLLKPGPPRQ